MTGTQLLNDRACLDHRRLEEAHIKYSILRVCKQYPKHFPKMIIHSALDQTLEEITPIYYKAFSGSYMGKTFCTIRIWCNHLLVYYIHLAHKCKFPGCGKVLVLDGNCKNQRDVCAATEAGYIEYPGLVGAIKTGCQFTPMRSSQYCYYHSPRISASHALPDPQTCNEPVPLTQLPKQHGVVQFIMARKVTRSQIYYQVSHPSMYDELARIMICSLNDPYTYRLLGLVINKS